MFLNGPSFGHIGWGTKKPNCYFVWPKIDNLIIFGYACINLFCLNFSDLGTDQELF